MTAPPAQTILPLLFSLDAALTGSGPDKIRTAARAWPATAREWVDDLYGAGHHSLLYLSDGGYSRVGVDGFALESGQEQLLFLASESRDAVKTRWRSPEARAARQAVEAMLREAFREISLEEERRAEALRKPPAGQGGKGENG